MAFLALLIATPPLAQSPSDSGPAPMPDQIYGGNGEGWPPVWIRPGHAVTQDGNLEASRFNPMALRRIRGALQRREESGCFGIEKERFDFQTARGALAKREAEAKADSAVARSDPDELYRLLSEAGWVLHGEVDGTSFGFHKGQPRLLARVRVLTTIHQPPRFSSYFVAVPTGSGTTDGYSFCLDGAGIHHEPAVGDELLLIARPGSQVFVHPDYEVAEAVSWNFLLLREGKVLSHIPAIGTDAKEIAAVVHELVDRYGYRLPAEDSEDD